MVQSSLAFFLGAALAVSVTGRICNTTGGQFFFYQPHTDAMHLCPDSEDDCSTVGALEAQTNCILCCAKKWNNTETETGENP